MYGVVGRIANDEGCNWLRHRGMVGTEVLKQISDVEWKYIDTL